MNVQPQELPNYNLAELPEGAPPGMGAADDDGGYESVARAIIAGERVLARIGGGDDCWLGAAARIAARAVGGGTVEAVGVAAARQQANEQNGSDRGEPTRISDKAGVHAAFPNAARMNTAGVDAEPAATVGARPGVPDV